MSRAFQQKVDNTGTARQLQLSPARSTLLGVTTRCPQVQGSPSAVRTMVWRLAQATCTSTLPCGKTRVNTVYTNTNGKDWPEGTAIEQVCVTVKFVCLHFPPACTPPRHCSGLTLSASTSRGVELPPESAAAVP